jgi:hypothetical protein
MTDGPCGIWSTGPRVPAVARAWAASDMKPLPICGAAGQPPRRVGSRTLGELATMILRPAASARVGIALLVTLAVVTACGPRADYELYVVNDTTQSWYIRTDRGQPTPRSWVVRIGPGGRGVTVGWAGTAEHQIELLDENCQPAGIFQGGGASVSVAGIAGVVGTIQPFGTSLDRTDDVIATTECGGYMPL